MKKVILSALAIFAFMLSGCVRDEPTAPVIPPPPAPSEPVKINELYSRGEVTNPDWVELYNSGASAVDISGYKIYDSGGQSGSKPKKEIPAGTNLAAGEYYVIVVDDTLDSGFGLSSSGEKIWVEKTNGAVIDSIEFPALGIDSSYARQPDGSAVWTILHPTTRGVTNGGSAASDPLVLNEIFSRGADPDFDWIEIYNPNTVALSLAGYKIYDGGGNLGTKPKFEFPADAIIPAGGYYVLTVDTQDAWGFGIGSGGDEVWLENGSGVVIDNQIVPAMPVTTTSYCRIPDGGTTWQISSTITKGSSNLP